VLVERLASFGGKAIEPLKSAIKNGPLDESIIRTVIGRIEGQTQASAYRERILWEYAQKIIQIAETTGLDARKDYICDLGREIERQFGLKGMQEVCYAVYHAMGNQGSISSWFNSAWNGIGQWRR